MVLHMYMFVNNTLAPFYLSDKLTIMKALRNIVVSYLQFAALNKFLNRIYENSGF